MDGIEDVESLNMTIQGPNLQNFVRRTCENVTRKKISLRKNAIFKKNLTKNVRKSYEKTYDSLLADLGKTSNAHAEIRTKNLRNRNLLTLGRRSKDFTKVLRKFVRRFVNQAPGVLNCPDAVMW